MTPDLISELATKYPELGIRVTDVLQVQEYLNQKIQEQADVQAKAYQQMMEADNNYYNSKMANDNALQNNFNKLLSAFVTNSGEAYNTDLKNYNNLSELKADLTNQYGETVAELITNFVTAQAEGYDVDLDNTVTWAQSKSQILKQLQAQIVKVETQLQNHLTRIQNAQRETGDVLIDEKLYARGVKKLNDLNSQVEEIQTGFAKYAGGFKGFNPTSFTSGFSGNSGGSGKGEKSSTEREVENLGDLRQRYYEVDNALKDVNNRLKENKTLMENANDKERIDYLKKEIALLGEKKIALENSRKARQQELQELKYQLELKNFTFDSNGKVTNQQQRVGFLTDWANSFSGDDKKSAQESVKNTVEILKKYTDLLLDDIPSITNEITNLANETASVNKEIAELYKQKLEDISDVEDEITNLIKDNAKKRIEEEKKVLEQALENDRKRIESKKKALEEERVIYAPYVQKCA